MTRVDVHHGIPDKLSYACRLLRKAHRSGASVVVTGDLSALKALDQALWVFDEQEFVPHVLSAGKPLPERLHATPIWLTPEPSAAPGARDVLLNLGPDMPADPGRYERVLDLVSRHPEDRQQGRIRWKAYLSQGLEVLGHEAKDEA